MNFFDNDRNLKKIFFGIWGLLLAFQIHGFSTGMWAARFPGAGLPEPIWGKARDIRADDWMVRIPTILSQTVHEPKFPELNYLIHPTGHEMVLGLNAPVRNWIAIFKPTTWGYFISPDFGLSWHWQLRIFALLGAAYAFFLLFFGCSPRIAAWGALCLLGSSFFAHWSYIFEPIFSAALLICVLLHRQFRMSRSSWGELALMYWAMVVFCVNVLYPPFQVPMIYFTLASGVYLLWSTPFRGRRFLAIVAALLLAGFTVALHLYENQEVLMKVLNTEYPGLRFSVGGELEVGRMLMMSFLALNGYGIFPGLNVSEAGSTYFVGMLGVLGFLFFLNKLPKDLKKLGWIFLGLTAFVGVYSFVGFPRGLSSMSGWSRVPAPRTLGLWSLLNIFWLVWWTKSGLRVEGKKQTIIVSLGLVVFFVFLAKLAQVHYPFLVWAKVFLGIVVATLISVLLARQSKWGRVSVLVVIFAGTILFNPLDRKTHSKIMATVAVQNLIKEFKESGKERVLLLDGNVATPNFLRMVGIPAYGGLHYVPQIEFWKNLSGDPDDSLFYNRFATVYFKRAPAGRETYFESIPADFLQVYLSPNDIEKFSQTTLVKDHLFK